MNKLKKLLWVFYNLDCAFIDFDLPSGNLWSTYNLGATGIEDPGLYFRWGELEGYRNKRINEKVYDQDGKILANYSWSKSNNTLLPKHDAAYNMSSGTLCIPSVEDFAELAANTQLDIDIINNTIGYKFIKENKSIFFPISTVDDSQSNIPGKYWTSTIYSNTGSISKVIDFNKKHMIYYVANFWEYQLIRPVLKL